MCPKLRLELLSKKIIPIFIISTLIACSEEYNLNLIGEEQKIVIEAFIDNDSQCLVKVTKSNSQINNHETVGYVNEPVKDAIIILSDEFGQSDTAFAIDPPIWDSVLDIRLSRDYNYRYSYNEYYQRIDTINYGLLRLLWNDYLGFKGTYSTTKFKAEPGHTYKLSVLINNKEYIAYDYMPKFELIIDSIIVKPILTDKAEYYVPQMYFAKPTGNNIYYSSSTGDNIHLIYGGEEILGLINTEELANYTYGMPICNENDFEKLPSQAIHFVYMYSLSESMYNYFKILSEQLNNDGGAYSPTPANLPSNFSNGALGYFKASQKMVYVIP